MTVHQVSLEKTAVRANQYPNTGMPELAFVGRSNVGKSSLINRLVGRKALARVSSAPGKTATINFYNVENKLYFVDLPGYGYAKVSRAERERWGVMIEEYLEKRKGQLLALVMLVDSRHEPTALDHQMLEWIRYFGYRPVIIATKTDKLPKTKVDAHLEVIRTALSLTEEELLLPFSAESGFGKDAVWGLFDRLLEEYK